MFSDMFTFEASHTQTSSGASYAGSAPSFSFASETSRQVMNHETRKRRNGDYQPSSIRGFAAQPWTGTSSSISHFESPAPLAHDRYTLAGGSIEGANSFTRQNGNYDDYFNLQTQRGMWSSPTSPVMRPLDRSTNTPSVPSSWVVGSLLNMVGGVAGRLFQFCTVPFRGFQAGGGQSYDADAQIKIASKLGLHDEPEPLEPAAPVQHIRFDPSPSDDYGVRSLDSIDTERPRMPKRLRTEDAWVMVGTDEAFTPTTNERSSSAIYDSPTSTPRLSERRTPARPYTPTPSQIPRPQSRASTPSSRRPSLIPVSRRSSTRNPLYATSLSKPQPHSRQRSFSRLSIGSSFTEPKPSHESKSSSSHAKRPSLSNPCKTSNLSSQKKKISPLPVDSQRLVSKLRREEMEDDARMRRMSSQMSAMLREAREALGSTVEIEDCEEMI